MSSPFDSTRRFRTIFRHLHSKLDESTSSCRDGNGDNDDDDKFSLVTVTSASLQESTGSTFTGSVCTDWQDKFACRALHRRGRIFSYRKRKTRLADGVFSAPAGVCPHRVTSSISRRNVIPGSCSFGRKKLTELGSRVFSRLCFAAFWSDCCSWMHFTCGPENFYPRLYPRSCRLPYRQSNATSSSHAGSIINDCKSRLTEPPHQAYAEFSPDKNSHQSDAHSNMMQGKLTIIFLAKNRHWKIFPAISVIGA
ncbi:uncharacterized protein LOC116844648 [Odontomachus brunneus]|uniref:uncharacterized protein LOC116844648 n=1 Tax=Odontomachus brunneus TaxID=486640 RepID=UPI0013F1BCDA|nr:uncharacterized protein LOC116844648 [Odontomachus brunneus]